MEVAPKRERAGRGAGVAEVEVSAATYGASIVALLALAAAVLLWGCGDDKLKRNDGLASVDPGQVDFGMVRVGDRVSVEVKLQNVGDAPLGVYSIEPDGEVPADFVLPSLTATRIAIAGDKPLAFGFAPTDEGARRGRVVIRTDSLERPTLTLDLGGEARRPLVTANDRLDFGRLVLNTDKVLRITAVNAAPVPARVTLEGVTGDDAALFTVGGNVPGGILDLAPRSSGLIEVRFVAGHLGAAAAVAHLRVEGALEPELLVNLAGEGFASDLTTFPNCLDFGSVSPNATSAPQTVTVLNGGNDAVAFQAPTLVDASGVFAIREIRVNGAVAPLANLGPGESAEIDVVFTPTGLGRFDGELQLRNSDRINPRLAVCLGGRGGGADIKVFPAKVNFGELTPGMAVTVPVMVSNVGTPDGGPLRVTGIAWDGPGQGAFVAPVLAAPVDLTVGGDPYRLDITFRPVEAGAFDATLYVESTDGDTPRYAVQLSGTARELPPCDWVAEPAVLRFGQVPKGTRATLAVALRNTGADDCIFSSVALARGAPAEFALPDGAINTATVVPGASLVVPVSVRPANDGALSTNLTFFVSNAGAPQGTVPITASGYTGCLTAQPGAEDFGKVRISCPAAVRSFKLYNQCGTPVDIASIELGAGVFTPGELTVTSAAPLTLPLGGQTEIQVAYDPLDPGVDGAPILVDAPALGDPIALAVAGEGTQSDYRTDRFTQKERQPVDVLFVLDNSGSMMEEQTAIGAGFADFIQVATAQGLDYHIGVTTTGVDPSGGGWATCPGGVDGGEAGRLFPVDRARPRWIDPLTPNADAVFAANTQVGVCHWWEEGLEAAYLALSSPLVDHADDPSTGWPDDGNLGFYRPDARLSVIIVTDEDDHSDRAPAFYTSFFQLLKPGRPDLVTVNGVLGNGCATASGDGVKYGQVIAATNGVIEPICTADWGQSLAKLAEASFGFTLRFPLTGKPLGPVEVAVNGQVQATGWTYDAVGNAVVFDQTAAPAPGAKITVRYIPACGS